MIMASPFASLRDRAGREPSLAARLGPAGDHRLTRGFHRFVEPYDNELWRGYEEWLNAREMEEIE